jgi:hypothetical protein
MEKILESALTLVTSTEAKIKSTMVTDSGAIKVYPTSIHKLGESIVMVARDEKSRFLLVVSNYKGVVPKGFVGEEIKLSKGGVALKCPLDVTNAAALKQHFPWTAPSSLRNVRTTVGCGDRLGLATRGHLLAAKKFAASPVLAQQSIRELTMTGRTFPQVVADAQFMVFEADYRDGYGADGDHLKTLADIDTALDAGMPMITLDLSEVMNAKAGDWSEAEVLAAFAEKDEETTKRINESYADCKFVVGPHEIKIDALTAKRCSVMYDAALDFAEVVYQRLVQRRGQEFDLEISIDETASPTLPSHHLYIVRELRRRGVEFSSVAPRFIGEFQKAVDYIGDLDEFDRQFQVHAAIAKTYGNYKVSIHSGSDKFGVYPSIGKWTEEYVHLKTAGTSWLVAVEVIAQNDPALYREIHKAAKDCFQDMLKLYHITADITKIPALETLKDEELPSLMTMSEARQMVHIAYGPILTGTLRERFFAAMHKFEAEYDKALEKHFDKHLSLLGVPAENK